jgi:hypothetical protein
MVTEHRRQLQDVDALVRALGQRDQPVEALPQQLDEIAARFEAEFVFEEGLLLGLRHDPRALPMNSR